MFIAQLHPSVCVGVGGRIIGGVSVYRMGIEVAFVRFVMYHARSFLWMFGIVWGGWEL